MKENTAEFAKSKTVTGVDVADDKETIAIRFGDGSSLRGQVYADCCSETWIEHVVAPELPGAVMEGPADLTIGDVNMADPPQECVEAYEARFILSTGVLSIEFRNASNGCYGGQLNWSCVEAET